MNPRLLIGIVLLAVGYFWNDIPSIESPLKPSTNYSKYIKLEKPNDKIFNELKDIKNIVVGPDEIFDRELIAIFHNEMANRISKYENITTIDFENYYYESAKIVFEGRITNKYKGLGDKLYQVVLSTLGENESIISKEEMGQLAEKLRAIAWILLN